MNGLKRLPTAGYCARSIAVAGLLVGLIAPAPVKADASNYRGPEVPMLPEYCMQDAKGVFWTQAERERWFRLLGDMVRHIHHYCRGLAATNRALYFSKNANERYGHLTQSIPEIQYVIGNAKDDYPLMPEFLYRKGDNLLRLNRHQEGVDALTRAMELKPDYWPPYAAMSDHYKRLGDNKKAREWLDKALAIAPDAKALKARLDDLNGKKDTVKSASETAEQPAPKPAKSQADPVAAKSKPAAGADSAAEKK